ncbi:MAG: hypothetical protein IJH43_05540 [Mogibacterium sp.]|nr:hypothetical protein [Mogibacterium sp.]
MKNQRVFRNQTSLEISGFDLFLFEKESKKSNEEDILWQKTEATEAGEGQVQAERRNRFRNKDMRKLL